ncbi:hypothetical protein C8J57DRAFT_1611267 [Mycena rebaudengoi]|nr:hypothetical protein C8J57DRAFT_1611267 [Mycena rebaudengoi]
MYTIADLGVYVCSISVVRQFGGCGPSYSPTLSGPVSLDFPKILGKSNWTSVDFESKWSAQEPAVIAKVLRVAAERYPYLTARRFPRSWATSAILQRYINNVRTYSSGKMNPDSGVSRRRQKLTKIGRLEANTRMQEHQSSPRRSLSPSAPNNEMDVDVDNAGGHNDRDDDGDGSDGQTSVNDMDDGFGSDASADLDGELSVLSD